MASILIEFTLLFIQFSRDCPIFYMRTKAQTDLNEHVNTMKRFGDPSW